ncbi:MAG: hypothetical protein EXR38_05785 [Methylotenera sp.]|nr:hypothetical protein [Methylotenera sp.]MSP99988.1 hypothetical protein [Methylotenera sp.]
MQTPLSRLSSGDVMMRIHVRRNTLIAIICSLLAHALFLFLVAPHIQMDNSSAPIPTALEVSFALPIPAQVVQPTPALQPPEKQAPKPIKPKVMTQKLNAHVKPWLSVPKVLDTPTPTTEVEPAQEHAKDAPVDMMAYVNAKRAQRQASEADAAQQNAQAVAREAGPSAEQMREERIKNNFKNGTNGIFEITSLSARHAGFSFRGWTNDYSNARQESFEVEAGIGQDVRLIMIRKMIWLIRQHYQDDFNWDSQRLGRVVSQSARPADNAGLEEFMMMEFFGSNYQKAS